MGSLKREELIATNSMILHEFYFGNLGGDGKPSGTIVEMVKAQYGSLDTWEREFRQTGLSLAGGSGWVVLAFDPHQNAVHTYWLWDHAHSLAWGTPLVVMDMYEHAYAMDYGANARGYVDAFPERTVGRGEPPRRACEAEVIDAPRCAGCPGTASPGQEQASVCRVSGRPTEVRHVRAGDFLADG